MAIHWKHWCPTGECGKCVIYIGKTIIKENKNKYQCQNCKRLFDKEELK